jgi:hypothetical protein
MIAASRTMSRVRAPLPTSTASAALASASVAWAWRTSPFIEVTDAVGAAMLTRQPGRFTRLSIP